MPPNRPWGFAESLAQEVAPLGVKVCTLRTRMRTNWGARAHKGIPDLLPKYEPSVGALVKSLHSLWARRIAIRPRRRSAGGERYSPCASPAGQRRRAVRWREMSVSTDVNAPAALPALQF